MSKRIKDDQPTDEQFTTTSTYLHPNSSPTSTNDKNINQEKQHKRRRQVSVLLLFILYDIPTDII